MAGFEHHLLLYGCASRACPSTTTVRRTDMQAKPHCSLACFGRCWACGDVWGCWWIWTCSASHASPRARISRMTCWQVGLWIFGLCCLYSDGELAGDLPPVAAAHVSYW